MSSRLRKWERLYSCRVLVLLSESWWIVLMREAELFMHRSGGRRGRTGVRQAMTKKGLSAFALPRFGGTRRGTPEGVPYFPTARCLDQPLGLIPEALGLLQAQPDVVPQFAHL